MPVSAFFRHQLIQNTFVVPPSEDYIKELQACWTDTKAFSHSTSDTQALVSSMAKHGLDHMPAMESAVASLIVSPDETSWRRG